MCLIVTDSTYTENISASYINRINALDDAKVLRGADVAVYNDSIAPIGYQGVWQDGVIAIKNMLKWLGLTFEEIDYMDLTYSTQDFSSLYKVILIPGGWAQWYNLWISLYGKERIRNFISNGGGYLGICAGAFFAVDRAIWEGILYDDEEGYNAWGEMTGYDLDLFPGIGIGPINEIADFNNEGYNMSILNFEIENTVLSSYKPLPYTESILYYGGPYFTPDEGAQVELLSTYDYNGEPAMVASQYGSGKVVLLGPHPEIEEDSFRDGVTMDREDEMDDNGSDWELVRYVLNWLMDRSISHTLIPPSDTIVAPGEVLGPFLITETNTSNSSYQFYVQPYVVRPDSTTVWFGQILTGLAAGQTRRHGHALIIPSWSEEGSFVWGVRLTDIDGNQIDDDTFTFTVRSW